MPNKALSESVEKERVGVSAKMRERERDRDREREIVRETKRANKRRTKE